MIVNNKIYRTSGQISWKNVAPPELKNKNAIKLQEYRSSGAKRHKNFLYNIFG